MPADAKTPEGFSLKRWSRLKQDAARETAPTEKAPVAPTAAVAVPAAPVNALRLPPVESLTPESDFTAFLQPKVDEALKRQALKKMFADPRFNVMDGLDVYIDDYTKTVPIPPDVLERLLANFTFNPPVAPGEKPQAPAANASLGAAPAPPDETEQLANKSTDLPDAPDPQDPAPSR